MSVSPLRHPAGRLAGVPGRHCSAADFAPPPALDRIQRLAVTAGGVGVIVLAFGAFLSPTYFFRSYLVAWVYCVGIAFGCLALLMLQHLTGGGWAVVVRRQLEAATRTIPLLAVLSLPLLGWGLPHVYSWANPANVRADRVLQAKAAYLNPGFFIARTLLYLAIAIILSVLLNRLSLAQDRTANPELPRRMRMVSGPGLVVFCLMVTFAAVDWLMSIEPHWSSTMYGFYLIASQALSAVTFTIIIALFLSRREPMSRVFEAKHFHDYGKLFLAFNMLWTYFCFSQFLITWAGNLPEEIFWYRHRITGGWGWVAMAVVVFHFMLPFSLLLSRDLKRRPQWLAAVASLMLAMRFVDLFWQAEPAYGADRRIELYWMYPAALLALGGIWLWAFADQLKKRPLLPINDPELDKVTVHE
ncbi:MAG TPA: hypothetical protein VHQ90_01145 [Thermoanaerobaculia bacterium]|nr:hypothetical protein [Thermoanaerobaculia bacterium]